MRKLWTGSLLNHERLACASASEINEEVDRIVLRLSQGESWIYHEGLLAPERTLFSNLDELAHRVLEHGTPYGEPCLSTRFGFGKGNGLLFQKRISRNHFEYRFLRLRD